jgi:hypothetical protein
MAAAAVMEAMVRMMRIVMDAPMATTPAISVTHHRFYSALLIRAGNLMVWCTGKGAGVQVACVKKSGVRKCSNFNIQYLGRP